MKKFILRLLLVVVFCGCGGRKVMAPPKIELKAYEKIGLLEFSSNAEGNLSEFVTQRFLQHTQASQPGVVILELSNQEINAAHDGKLDPASIRAIAKNYRLDAIFVGHLKVEDVKPKVNLNSFLASLNVKAEVEAALLVRLYECKDGATLWTSSAHGKEEVAHVSLMQGGPTTFDAKNPEKAYGNLADKLIRKITMDFRARYVRQN